MTRLRGMIVCAGVSLGLTAGMALAVPPVLEKAPKDAMFVIAIPSADKLEKDLQSLTTAARGSRTAPAAARASVSPSRSRRSRPDPAFTVSGSTVAESQTDLP